MIGGDGNVYEGRSWNAVGAHTYGFNDVGYGTCFLGDFMDELPTADAVNAGLAQQNVKKRRRKNECKRFQGCQGLEIKDCHKTIRKMQKF